mmetsp:Transcript_25461/g.37478  ORF Transcript_25461/g.37478 Transcript_25461/m.37478 type:complete len:476 (-) Transcript_25461:39-1466(-)
MNEAQSDSDLDWYDDANDIYDQYRDLDENDSSEEEGSVSSNDTDDENKTTKDKRDDEKGDERNIIETSTANKNENDTFQERVLSPYERLKIRRKQQQWRLHQRYLKQQEKRSKRYHPAAAAQEKEEAEPHPMLSREQALVLIVRARDQMDEASLVLDEARVKAKSAGLAVDSSIVNPAYKSPFLALSPHHTITNQNASIPPRKPNALSPKALSESVHRQRSKYGVMRGGLNCFPLVLETTGGHSNKDHLVQCTNDPKADRVAEFKRNLRRRAASMRPEQKGEDRWDQKKVAGGRRRRIYREKDQPCAPPEPPTSGYVLYISQMTTKIRHDNPKVQHDQIKVVGVLSKTWKYGMSSSDREYYLAFSSEAKEEYVHLIREFRATGAYTPSLKFGKLLGYGPWIRLEWDKKNELEKEISTYKKIVRPGTAMTHPDYTPSSEDEEEESVVRNEQHFKDGVQEHQNNIIDYEDNDVPRIV